MTTTFTQRALAGVAGLLALSAVAAAPTFAAAQPAPYSNGYGYDPCRRASTNRGTAGALIGGALGAVIGSNAAARNARTEGALLGGALGAAVGAGVGHSSAACRSGPFVPGQAYENHYRPHGYYDQSYYDRRDTPYRDGPADETAYDRDGYSVTETVTTEAPAGADGCTLAESPIYLPDGRTQKRFVRVCRDANGDYQVVD